MIRCTWLLLVLLAACSATERPTYLGPDANFTESGLEYIFLKKVNGQAPELGNELTAHCTLKVGDSVLVWQTAPEEPYVFTYSQAGMIKGFVEAIGLMNEGDRIKVIIPPDLGYGAQASNEIPAYAYLSFDIELVKVEDQMLWIADSLFEAYRLGGHEEGVRSYRRMQSDGTGRYRLKEQQLKVLGSKLRNDGRLNDYFELLKFRAGLYPDSFSAHMELASAYLDRGNAEGARSELVRCLEISPGNPAAEHKLEEL